MLFLFLLYSFMILNFFSSCTVIDMKRSAYRSIWKGLHIAAKHSLRSCLRPSRPSLSVVLRRLADPFGEKNFFVNRFKVWSDIFFEFFYFLVMCFCYILFWKKYFFNFYFFNIFIKRVMCKSIFVFLLFIILLYYILYNK